jgi:hypothetical protein
MKIILTRQDLQKLFSSQGLKNIDKDFQEIVRYQTACHYIFHLYRVMDWRTGKGEILELNLLDPKHIWKHYGDTNISQFKDNLNIAVTTNKTDKLFNRAFLTTQLSLRDRPQLLTLEYSTNSINGSGIFFD